MLFICFGEEEEKSILSLSLIVVTLSVSIHITSNFALASPIFLCGMGEFSSHGKHKKSSISSFLGVFSSSQLEGSSCD